MSGMNVTQQPSSAGPSLQNLPAVTISRRREKSAEPRQLLPLTPCGKRNVDIPVPPRAKNSKSRNGCLTCKARRRKCDEAKPSCSQCTSRKIVCGGYRKTLRWKEFDKPEHGRLSTLTNEEANLESNKFREIQHSLELDVSLEGNGNGRDQAPGPFRNSSNDVEAEIIGPVIPRSIGDDEDARSRREDNNEYRIRSSDVTADVQSPFNSQDSLADFDAILSQFSTVDDPTSQYSSLVASRTAAFGDEYDFANLPEFDFSTLNALNEHLEHNYRRNGHTKNVVNFQSFGLNNETWNLLPEFRLTSSLGANAEGVFSIYQKPHIHGDSPENIAILFDRRICEVLCIKENPNDNPWRKIVWPLAKEHAALYHAIAAMTCFQASNNLPQFRAKGIRHLQHSAQMLPTEGQGSMHLEAALTVAVALGFAETWYYPRSSTGISHIKRAKGLLQKALARQLSSHQPEDNLVCLRFLASTWIYMDVITRITCQNVQTLDFELMNSCSILNSKTGPGFQIDPLMGCAETLFPLLGRVADLVTRVREMKQKLNSLAIVSKAVELKTSIERWSPHLGLNVKCDGESLTSTTSDLIQTANAYKWATLLLLCQAVPELPTQLSVSDLAQKVLILLATVPLESRAIIFPVFPLMVAGCEATEVEDRDWVRERWHSLSTGNSSGIVDRCLELTLEVWRRRDCYNSNPTCYPTAPSETTAGSIPELNKSLNLERDLRVGQDYAFNEEHVDESSRYGISEEGMEFTVKSNLHWINVMKEWGWEVMLG